MRLHIFFYIEIVSLAELLMTYFTGQGCLIIWKERQIDWLLT